jgi:hypothetical protein
LMSELLDPMHRRYLQSLDVVKPGARTLEVDANNLYCSSRLRPGRE